MLVLRTLSTVSGQILLNITILNFECVWKALTMNTSMTSPVLSLFRKPVHSFVWRDGLTSGLVFSGALNPGNWGIAVVEDILNGRGALQLTMKVIEKRKTISSPF